ncbi:TPA: phage recombination protein Bet, partial [Clostridioides difficile]|nr:phage recombination protein Bet [Clostridioides difficile]
FIKEAYLIKFGNSPANIVVGKDVFVKRANKNPNFEGMKAGIVTANKNGEVFEREGSLKLPQEELIGGWCEVSVRGMKFPIKSVVSLEEYSKSQATWKQMPCVMIRKCAIVTALREAFPEDLQGLYDSAEIKTVPDKLPQKPIEIGKASPSQKQGILKLASIKGLYDYENKKDTSKLEEFCESNGLNLKELKFEEVDELIELLSEYEPKDDFIDAEFEEVKENEVEIKEEVENIDGQVSMEEAINVD